MPNKPIPELTEKQRANVLTGIEKRGPDACWEWTAGKNWDGYGQVMLRPAGMFLAHRIMYYLATGKQPGLLCVCHTCDNPGCVNPAHLFLGTVADNMADKDAKGRLGPLGGVDNGHAKLTEEQVLAIRASGETRHVLAARYGVTQVNISRIKTRKIWKHI